MNVVPTTATVSGTLRTFTDAQREDAFGRLRQLCADIGDLHEVQVELAVPEQPPAVVNDAGVTATVEAEAQTLLGAANVLRMPPASPSDDVSEFLNHLPWPCYFFVGGGAADGSGGMHHSPTFSVEDGSLRVGASVMAASAVALATP